MHDILKYKNICICKLKIFPDMTEMKKLEMLI